MLRWVSNKSSRLNRKKRNHHGHPLHQSGLEVSLEYGAGFVSEKRKAVGSQSWHVAPQAWPCYEVLSQVYQEPELAKTKMNYDNVNGIALWRRSQMWSHAFSESIAIIINVFQVLPNVAPSKFSGSSSGHMVLTQASTL